MGAAGSVMQATAVGEEIGTAVSSFVLRGKEELTKLEASLFDSTEPSLMQLILLRLGLESATHESTKAGVEASTIFKDLHSLSKGEETIYDSGLEVIEASSLSDLLAFVTSCDVEKEYLLTAECAEIEELSLFSSSICENADKLRALKGLNLSSNKITDAEITKCSFFSTCSLYYLHMGGNQLGLQFANMLANNALGNLLILDLSFTENLAIKTSIGLVAPQLVRLVLDGCSIESTFLPTESTLTATADEADKSIHAKYDWGKNERTFIQHEGDNQNDFSEDSQQNVDMRPDGPLERGGRSRGSMIQPNMLTGEISADELIQSDEQSIFWGLVRLRELSLKENILETPASLQGLAYFNFGSKHQDILQPTLTHLWLDENPYQYVSAMKKCGEEMLRAAIPSLEYLDDKHLVEPEKVKGKNVSEILKDFGVSDVGNSAIVGGVEGFDNMEKEYLVALKNERDTTVVA